MLEFRSRLLKFSFNDKVVEIRFPNVRELKAFTDGYEKSEDKVDIIIDLIVKLGMKKEECELLEMDMMNSILTELTAEKK